MGCASAAIIPIHTPNPPSISVKTVIWFDENINDNHNLKYHEKLKKKFGDFKGYTNLEEGL